MAAVIYSFLLLVTASLLTLGCFTQTAAANPLSPARSTPVQRHVLTAQATQQSTAAEQLITLTTAAEHFSALFLPANRAVAQGVVILLPGLGETFDWPIAIGPLRRKLPDAGWHSLSLNLPEAPREPLTSTAAAPEPVPELIRIMPPSPAITEPEPITNEFADANATIEEDNLEFDEPAVEDELPGDTETLLSEQAATEADTPEPAAVAVEPIPIPAYPQRIHDFINAAVDYATSLEARHIVLLGHHERAHWVLDYATQYATATPVRLVLISPRNSPFVSQSYQDLIRISTLPIADFYYKDVSLEQQAAQQRINASRQAGLTTYHQVALNAHAGPRDIEQELLFRRVKGWLNKPLKPQ